MGELTSTSAAATGLLQVGSLLRVGWRVDQHSIELRGRSPGEALARRARHIVPKLVEIKLMCIRFQTGLLTRACPTSFYELHVEARQNQRPRHHHWPRHP